MIGTSKATIDPESTVKVQIREETWKSISN